MIHSLSSLCLSADVIVARGDHTSVVLSDGSVLVMGGVDITGRKNDVWRTVNAGASWIQITSSAGWSGKVIQPTHCLSSLGEDARRLNRYSVSCSLYCKCDVLDPL